MPKIKKKQQSSSSESDSGPEDVSSDSYRMVQCPNKCKIYSLPAQSAGEQESQKHAGCIGGESGWKK